jgi:hypothetical protein
MMVAAFAFAVATVGVLLIPLILGRLVTSEGDYSRISDIGQAYGAASAVISAVALGLVVLGQYRQAHRARLQALFDMTDELVQLAMDEPMYRQCWGTRMAPDDIDEALFYYCNRMIKSWKIAWELRDLSEAQARAYLASFSERDPSTVRRCLDQSCPVRKSPAFSPSRKLCHAWVEKVSECSGRCEFRRPTASRKSATSTQ